MDTIGENILDHFDEAYEFLGNNLKIITRKMQKRREMCLSTLSIG